MASLAAYSEGRLFGAVSDAESDSEIIEIEEFLSARPEIVVDLWAARDATASEFRSPTPEKIILRAQSLIVEAQAGVEPFRPRRAPWRAIAVAASLVAAGVVGFTIGMDDWLSLANAAGPSLSQEFMDPPGTMLANFDEDSNL
jgi:hypothetical protein